jgi:hypothetical protein
MPVMKIATNLAAAGDQAFPLQGQQYEILTFPALVEFAITTDVAVTRASVYSGSDLLQQSGDLDVLAAANPQLYPDHFTLNDIAGTHDRLSVQLNKVSGAANVVRTQVRVTRLR